MGNANVSNVTIRPEEAEFFAGLALRLVEPQGADGFLASGKPGAHGIYPQAIDSHWPRWPHRPQKPLAGKAALDIGLRRGAGVRTLGAAGRGCDRRGRGGGECSQAAAAHAEGCGARYSATWLARWRGWISALSILSPASK